MYIHLFLKINLCLYQIIKTHNAMKKLIKPVFVLSIIATLAACGGTEKKMDDKAMMDKDGEETMKKEMMEEQMLSVNTADSKVMWSGSILGAYSHEGTLDITEGSLKLEGENIVGGKFMVDMTSITPTDDGYNEEKTPEMLVGHLSSADFFLVDSFPTASFVVKSADMEAKTITGDLTVRGVTNEETIQEVAIDMATNKAKGLLTFNRQDYGVAFSHPAEDVVVSDDIELTISLKM